MRHLFFSVTAALALAGCAADRQDAEATSAAQRSTQTPQAPRPTALAAATRQSSFASLPDRGALLAYAPGREVIKRGAETYRAVELSEAHALNAAAPGRSIELPTPSGETLRIGFQRVEESLDGNWSWIGRTADGQDAVITFGEKAVFGRIAQRGTEALRLTTSGGRSWLVETDPSRVLDANNAPGATSDMLVPPSTASAILARKAAAQLTTGTKVSAQLGGVDTKAGPSQIVDVVVGYTNGLATRLGGTSQATTRISNLIALTNQAYVNSSITPRVRLVNTLQVNYTDTNSNDVALEELTGITCTATSCSSQTVPAALVPLRSARDQYGGDLVSLLRPLQQPQQTGCGISWLNGGGGTAIDNADADFGYSVVSDGTDVDETDGRTYSCSDTSLAHEMGHNMGQQHNIENSAESGTHSYSYGYRETSTTGFYTIMAYRLANSSQFEINYFGNPSINYTDTGRPTGTATANNAASLNITMPLVAQFRAAVVSFGKRPHNDFSGDGKSDIVLWNPSLAYLGYWIMNGPTYTGSAGFSVAANNEPVVSGFMHATEAHSSLVVRNQTASTLSSYIWNTTSSAYALNNIGGYAAGWNVIGMGDIDGDGKDDLLWRNPTSGQFAYWLMNGTVFVSAQTYSPPVTYVVAGVGDFNGDGRSDLLWNDPGTRNASIWLSTGSGFTVGMIGQYGTDWNMVGVADVTGDGKADILLRDNGKTYLAFWKMDGAVYQGSTAFGLAGDYDLLTTGDFDGDGIEDVVVSRASDRSMRLWRSTGTAFTQSNIGQYGTGWSVVK